MPSSSQVQLRREYEDYARKAKSEADYKKTFLGKSTLFLDGVARGLGLAAEKRDEFGLPKDRLDHLRAEAEKLRRSIREEQRARADDAARNEARHVDIPDAAPRGPLLNLEAPISVPEAAVGLAAGHFLRMVEAACAGEWTSQATNTNIRLTDGDFEHLVTHASHLPPGCTRALTERLISMLRAGESISSERLRTEAAAASPPVQEGFVESAPRGNSGGCVKRGIWYKDCY